MQLSIRVQTRLVWSTYLPTYLHMYENTREVHVMSIPIQLHMSRSHSLPSIWCYPIAYLTLTQCGPPRVAEMHLDTRLSDCPTNMIVSQLLTRRTRYMAWLDSRSARQDTLAEQTSRYTQHGPAITCSLVALSILTFIYEHMHRTELT